MRQMETTTTDLRRLLARYYDGRTSPDEDRRLREWLESDACPAECRKDRDAMRLLERPQPAAVPEGLQEDVMRAVRRTARRRVWWRTGWSVAAAVMLLAGAGLALRDNDTAGSTTDMAAMVQAADAGQRAEQPAADSTGRAEKAAEQPAPTAAKRKKRKPLRRRPESAPPVRYYAEATPMPETPAAPDDGLTATDEHLTAMNNHQTATDGKLTAENDRLTAEEEEPMAEEEERIMRRLVVEHIRELLEQHAILQRVLAQDDADFFDLDEEAATTIVAE